jgi:hypothetical protein
MGHAKQEAAGGGGDADEEAGSDDSDDQPLALRHSLSKGSEART